MVIQYEYMVIVMSDNDINMKCMYVQTIMGVSS